LELFEASYINIHVTKHDTPVCTEKDRLSHGLCLLSFQDCIMGFSVELHLPQAALAFPADSPMAELASERVMND
jgi:hypothetical protein